MSKKLGTLIKDARTKKGLSQAELASRIDGLSAAALSKAERGESEPEEAVLRAIAKELGVTQTSLVSAASGKAAPKTAAKTAGKTASSKTAGKTAASKTTTSKTAASKTTASKTTAKSTAGKTAAKSTAKGSLTLTATEKKLVELYRSADKDTKKAAMNLLSGKDDKLTGLVSALLGEGAAGLLGSTGSGKKDDSGDLLNTLINSAAEMFRK